MTDSYYPPMEGAIIRYDREPEAVPVTEQEEEAWKQLELAEKLARMAGCAE